MAERRAIPVYLSLEEAAEAMSVSVKTIRRWIAAGTLPAYRCGKRGHPHQARRPGGRTSADPLGALVMRQNVASMVYLLQMRRPTPLARSWHEVPQIRPKVAPDLGKHVSG